MRLGRLGGSAKLQGNPEQIYHLEIGLVGSIVYIVPQVGTLLIPKYIEITSPVLIRGIYVS